MTPAHMLTHVRTTEAMMFEHIHEACEVANWLTKDRNATDARPIQVTIKGKRYPGASYKQGDSTERLYLIGKLPASYRRSSHTVFNFAGDARDWYVACYMPRERITKELEHAHPFGETFMLCPWQVPSGEAIDRFAPSPYTRVAAEKE